jgi:hypothetical protein
MLPKTQIKTYITNDDGHPPRFPRLLTPAKFTRGDTVSHPGDAVSPLCTRVLRWHSLAGRRGSGGRT